MRRAEVYTEIGVPKQSELECRLSYEWKLQRCAVFDDFIRMITSHFSKVFPVLVWVEPMLLVSSKIAQSST